MVNFNPKLVVFACENSGMKAAEEAEKLKLTVPEKLTIVSLPCGGRLDTAHILKALERGADGVVVLVCHIDNCRYLHGNERTVKRVDELKRLLDAAGIEPNRLTLSHIAAVEPAKFVEILNSACEKISDEGRIVNY